MIYPFYTDQEAERAIRAAGLDMKAGPDPSLLSCCSMLVERLSGLSFPPEVCARFAVRCGAHYDPPGTLLLMGALAGRFSLRLQYSEDARAAFDGLRPGMSDIVRYSDRLHTRASGFLLADGADSGEISVLDPAYMKGKGLPRTLKRSIRSVDDHILLPADTFFDLYGEQFQLFCFSAE